MSYTAGLMPTAVLVCSDGSGSWSKTLSTLKLGVEVLGHIERLADHVGTADRASTIVGIGRIAVVAAQ